MSVTSDGSTPHATVKGEPATSSVLCWETWRLRATLPKIVSRAMSFSALPRFDTALVAAVHRFYGIDVDVATAETEILEDDLERVRFFPWFLWDWPMAETPANASPNGAEGADGVGAANAATPEPSLADDDVLRRVTVGRRFLAEGELEPIEARLLEALCDSTVGFAEVVAIDGATLFLSDLMDRETFSQPMLAATSRGIVTLEDATLAREVAVGSILQARFLHVDDIGLVDTIYAVLPAAMRATVTAELARTIGDAGGVASDPALAALRLKARAPELLELAERLLEGLERTDPPLAEDGEALVLCATALTGSGAEAVASQLATDVRMAARTTRIAGLWRIHDLGFVDTREAPRRVLVGASTKSAMTKLRATLLGAGVALPVLQSEEDFPRAAAQWVERGNAGTWLDGDPRAATAFRAWLGDWSKRWVDAMHPKLGRSPREAARDPLGRSAVVELLRRMERVAGSQPAEQLGLQLGLPALANR
jgi:hypothetical protein